MKNSRSGLYLVDWLVILFNVTYHLSIVKIYSFDLIPIPPIISLSLLTILLYVIRWKGKLSFLLEINRSALLMIFFSVYIFDIIQNIFLNEDSAISRSFTLVNIFFFCSYLYNLITPNKSCHENIMTFTKPYLYYSVYNVIVVVLAGSLIALGFLSPVSNPLSVNSLTKVDVASGQSYYFPAYLSIVTESSRLFTDWGIPMITGLSHEPHVLNYLILPAMFIILSSITGSKWKMIVYVVFIVEFFFSFSTTAFFSLILVFLIDVLWNFRRSRFVSFFPFVFFIVIIVFSFGGVFIELILGEINRKTVSATSSLEYSSAMLYYLTHPQNFWGSGNMPGTVIDLESKDVGAITFLLDLAFYFIMLINCLKISFSKDRHIHYIGLACLYMLIHTLKVNFLSFNYPYLAYIVFIVFYCKKKYVVKKLL